jgi:hypothetical protein
VDKCHFSPAHLISYLGWEWNFKNMECRMSGEKKRQILKMIKLFSNNCLFNKKVPCRRVAHLMDSLVFLRFQFPQALLYLAKLHKLIASVVREGGWDAKITLHRGVLDDGGESR